MYQIFGSENSLDYDIVIFIDSIPSTIDESHMLCKKYNSELSLIHSDKVVNSNLAVVKDGFIVDCFKGTIDELNNSLFYTYKNHTQPYPLQITSVLERNIDKKILRVCRGILSFYSRTDMRDKVKPALRGDLRIKIPVLKDIDFTKMLEFPNKKESIKDIYKVISFQFGQLFSLLDGFESESYTKSDIIKNYPKLSNMLNRSELTPDDLNYLNESKTRLLNIIDCRIDQMIKLTE